MTLYLHTRTKYLQFEWNTKIFTTFVGCSWFNYVQQTCTYVCILYIYYKYTTKPVYGSYYTYI